MKKFFIALLAFISINSMMQTMYADTPITLDDKSRDTSNGPRRAPKKIVAPFEFDIDEIGKTISFSTFSEEHLVIVIIDDKEMLTLYDVLDINPDTDGIISLESFDKGEYIIYIYDKGVETKEKFTIQ